MAKGYYLPYSDQDRVGWLNNFAQKFPVYAALLNLTSEVSWVTNDAVMLAYIVGRVEFFTAGKEQLVNFKNLLRNGPIATVPAVPVMPVSTVTAPTTNVAPGIFVRIPQLVQRIKNSAAYTEAIGKDLGIIGAEIIDDFTVLKPKIKVVPAKGGTAVEIQWAKGKADSIYIEADRGTGWQFLAIDTVPHYIDNAPITAPATWKYRAQYLVNDERVGEMSDTVSITVG
jgi:hypothetical protein